MRSEFPRLGPERISDFENQELSGYQAEEFLKRAEYCFESTVGESQKNH